MLASALEKQVTARLRQHGLVVWLDREGHCTSFVDGLGERHQAGQFFAPVLGFRGSFLELMIALEPFLNGLDPEPLLIHLPGHTDVTVRQTPMLEAYRAGTRFERALDTLIREVAAGQVAPDKLEAFLKQPSLTLAGAEEWLESQVRGDSGELASYLRPLLPEWVLDQMIQAGSDLRKRIQTEDDWKSLFEYLQRHTGLSAEFAEFHLRGEGGRPLQKARTLEEAVLRYTGSGKWPREDGIQSVDRAHPENVT